MTPIQEEIKRVVGYIKRDFKLDNLTFYYSTPAEFIELLTATPANKY